MQKIFKNLKTFIFAALLISASVSTQAQQGGNDDIFSSSMQDMWVVLGTTAGGAILGLSTLSFVEEPSEHLKNVVVGGAIGVIVGVGVVAYKQATVSQELYQGQQGFYRPSSTPEMSTDIRTAWHTNSHSRINNNLGSRPSPDTQAVNFQFSF